MSIRRLSTRLVYENRWMRVARTRSSAPPAAAGIVEKQDFALIIGLLLLGEKERAE
jgi:hypothetical protein